MADLIYPDLSYKIVGLAFEVFKELGEGLREKVYCDAFELLLKREMIPYQREIYHPIEFEGKKIAVNYFDFLVDKKIVLEFKCGSKSYYQAFNQLKNYLKLSDLKLGIILRFSGTGVEARRIVNSY